MNTSIRATKPAVSPLPDIIGLGGAIAGLGGGLAMAVVGALIARSMGQDTWLEPKQIASVIYGQAAVEQPGFVLGPVLAGTLLHLIASAALGALFSILIRRLFHLTSEFGTPLLVGLVYGLLVWLVAYFIVLPLFSPPLRETYAPAFIAQHIIYGSVTGLLYTWLRPQPYNALD